MIAHCPACGTHFRHDVLASPMRGRCGRCDAAIDLSRLRPYRVVVPRTASAVALAEAPPIVVTSPAVMAEPAPEPAIALAPAPAALTWETEDPLPPIPEMAMTEMAEHVAAEGTTAAVEPERTAPALPSEGRGTTWLLWVAAGAIAGTGTSWTLGGTTLAGVAAGTLAGAIAGWGWLRWMSPR